MKNFTNALLVTGETSTSGDLVLGSAATSHELLMNDTANGYIDSGDTDWYRVFLVAGQTYNFTLTKDGISSSTFALDPFLILYAPTGGTNDYLAYNDDKDTTTSNSLITYTPELTGYYFISAESYSTNQHGSYTLGVTGTNTIAADSIGHTAATASTIVAGGESRFSSINTQGDIDWFAMDVVAGQNYSINLVAMATTGTGIDTYLSIVDATGHLIAYDDDSGTDTNSALTFSATTTTTIYLQVAALGGTGATGDYFLNVTAPITQTTDTETNTSSTSGVITIGGQVSSHLDNSGDTDWFGINLVAGQTYVFDMSPQGQTPLTDAYLSLYNSAGTLIAIDDDGSQGLNAQLVFTVQTTGRYYIEASSALGTEIGAYTVTANTTTKPSPLVSIDWGTSLTITDGFVDIYFAASGETFDGIASLGWNEYEISRVLAAGTMFSQFINLQFRQTTDASSADFKMVVTDVIDGDSSTLGFFNTPGSLNGGVGVFARSGQGWDEAGSGGLEAGGYAFNTLIHEMGHGLGLAHPHDNGGTSSIMMGVTDSFYSYGTYLLNQGVYTIMSYNDAYPSLNLGTVSADLNTGWVATAMPLDIALLQQKYGANTTFNNGDTVYTFNQNGYYAIWDTGGNDTIDFSAETDIPAFINLNAATLDYSLTGGGNLSISLALNTFFGLNISAGSIIENAIGTGSSDILTGNAVANRLIGGLGNDTLSGGLGADVLDGGNGFDVTSYANAASGVTVFLGAPQLNTGEAAGDSLLNLEGIIGSNFGDILWGTRYANSVDGGAGNDWLYGQDGQDTILGGDGSDVISGGLGADSLDGGAGKDVAFYRDATASVYSVATHGTKADMIDGHTYGISLDTTSTINSFGEATGDTLTNIENIWGSNFDDIIRGSDSVGGQVYGFWGNDLLDGRGGNDVFYGGVGSDTIITGTGADDIYYKSYHDQRNAFGTLEPFEGGDTITDFEHGVDHVTVSRYWFGFGNIVGVAQSLTSQYADFITSGTTAISTKPTFFYDQATGQLMFDPDGTGKGAAVLMMTFSNNVNLTLSDIWTA